MFLEALKLHGREWKSVKDHVRTRTSTQSRSHAQKFLAKLKRKGKTLEQFLDDIDFSNIERMNSSALEFDEETDLLLSGAADPEVNNQSDADDKPKAESINTSDS